MLLFVSAYIYCVLYLRFQETISNPAVSTGSPTPTVVILKYNIHLSDLRNSYPDNLHPMPIFRSNLCLLMYNDVNKTIISVSVEVKAFVVRGMKTHASISQPGNLCLNSLVRMRHEKSH